MFVQNVVPVLGFSIDVARNEPGNLLEFARGRVSIQPAQALEIALDHLGDANPDYA